MTAYKSTEFFYFFKVTFKTDFTYLFLERGEGKEKERERNINVWLPLALRTLPKTQACALTGVAQLVGHPPANKRSQVRFPVRAHAWVSGRVPG